MQQYRSDAYEEWYEEVGQYYIGDELGNSRLRHIFYMGFRAGLNFVQDQNDMDRDYQEELNQQDALRRGEA